MAEKILSDLQVKSANVAQGEQLLADGGNLYLRLRPVGKDWLFIYRFDGKQRKYGLGSYPSIGLAAARKLAADARVLLVQNKDPRVERENRLADARIARAIRDAMPESINELFELWVRKELVRRKDGGAEAIRKFNKEVLPAIGRFPISAVRRVHVADVLDAIAARGSHRVAGLVLGEVRQMFRFAVTREIIPADPTFGLKKGDWNGQSNERERVLSESEIRQLITQLESAKMQPESVHTLWIMLGTGCRIVEITQAHWSRVDFDNAEWRIPVSDSKNKKEHLVHLSPFALKHFLALKQLTGESEWVLPAQYQSGAVCKKSLGKQLRDRQTDKPLIGRTKAVHTLNLPGGRWPMDAA